jgi:hypothetical protein
MSDDNKRVVLIAAPPSTGKTHSLFKMAKDGGVAYLNTDLKDPPFRIPKGGMKRLEITEPWMAHHAIEDLEENYPEVYTVILDTITFLMNQYETQYVIGDERGHGAAWGEYAQFYNQVMHAIKSSAKNYIILAHTSTSYNEKELANETKVPIKGSVGKIGPEADYNIILSSRKISTKELKPYLTKDNKLLTLTEREKRLGFKYVFQTDLTKESLDLKIRSPMGLWEEEELFIDNDIALVTQRVTEYYS